MSQNATMIDAAKILTETNQYCEKLEGVVNEVLACLNGLNGQEVKDVIESVQATLQQHFVLHYPKA